MNRRVICALLVTLALAGGLARAEEHYEVIVERNVPVKMRDGVVLRADIYRPKAEGKFPVLLTRTPYDKRGEMDFGPMAAARGYVVVTQDVRGRYTSEGEWYTFKNESQDGYDTVEWAAALPYSNGKVGMFGGSYVGATQMLAAIASPPHLAGILPIVTASNYHENWTYQGGAFEQWFDQSWTTGLAENTLDRRMSKDSYATRWDTTASADGLSPAGSRHSDRLGGVITSIGWRIPAMTTIGSSGRLKNTSPKSRFPLSTLPRGTTSSRTAHFETTWGSRPTAAARRLGTASGCW